MEENARPKFVIVHGKAYNVSEVIGKPKHFAGALLVTYAGGAEQIVPPEDVAGFMLGYRWAHPVVIPPIKESYIIIRLS